MKTKVHIRVFIHTHFLIGLPLAQAELQRLGVITEEMKDKEPVKGT